MTTIEVVTEEPELVVVQHEEGSEYATVVLPAGAWTRRDGEHEKMGWMNFIGSHFVRGDFRLIVCKPGFVTC